MNETLEVIRRRRSVRAFLPEQLKDAEVRAIVEAGQFAPNGGGENWHFTVIQNVEVLERLHALAKRYAAGCGLPWLEELGQNDNFHSTYHAPTVILVSADKDSVTAVYDVSAATENILLAAESLQIGSCWGYFVTQAFETAEGNALKREFSIPESYRVYTSVMLGYRAGDAPETAPRKPGCVTYIK